MISSATGEKRSVNEVKIVGRLGAKVSTKCLPSGDEITVFSIVIDRPAREVRGSTQIDTIACVTTKAQLAGRLNAWEPGRWIEAEGVLRRRFWRAGGGLGSAMEVDVRRMKSV
jgi:single-strand DNA-binding protein